MKRGGWSRVLASLGMAVGVMDRNRTGLNGLGGCGIRNMLPVNSGEAGLDIREKGTHH